MVSTSCLPNLLGAYTVMTSFQLMLPYTFFYAFSFPLSGMFIYQFTVWKWKRATNRSTRTVAVSVLIRSERDRY